MLGFWKMLFEGKKYSICCSSVAALLCHEQLHQYQWHRQSLFSYSISFTSDHFYPIIATKYRCNSHIFEEKLYWWRFSMVHIAFSMHRHGCRSHSLLLFNPTRCMTYDMMGWWALLWYSLFCTYSLCWSLHCCQFW